MDIVKNFRFSFTRFICSNWAIGYFFLEVLSFLGPLSLGLVYTLSWFKLFFFYLFPQHSVPSPVFSLCGVSDLQLQQEAGCNTKEGFYQTFPLHPNLLPSLSLP